MEYTSFSLTSMPSLSISLDQSKESIDHAWGTVLNTVDSVRTIEELKRFSKELDFLNEDLRAKIWGRFTELVFGREEVQEKYRGPQYQFFSPMMDGISQLPGQQMHESYLVHLIEVIHELKIPIATSIFTRIIASHFTFTPKLEADTEKTETPECCPKTVLLPKKNSPFGRGEKATLAQLRCLKLWADVLDELAPATKTAIWRLCMTQGNNFGFDHDILSFKKTISLFQRNVDTYTRSIAILFSVLGLLRNEGVITRELYWPDQRDGALFACFSWVL